MTRLRLVAAQNRSELGPLLALTVLVALCAFLLAAAPRHLAAAEAQALRATLDDASAAELELSASSTNEASVRQLDVVDEQLRAGLGPALADRVTSPVRTVVSDLFDTYTVDGEHLRPQPFAWLLLAHQPGLLDDVRWVEGGPPMSPRTPGTPGTATVPTDDGPVPLVRVALEDAVAEQLDLRVGPPVVLRPLSARPGGVGAFAVQLSGTFERPDPDDPRWDYLTQVWEPGERYTPDGSLLAEVGAALVDPSQLRALQDVAGTLRYDWHYPVAPSSVTPGSVDEVLAAVRASVADASSATVPVDQPTYVEPTVTMSSGLVDVLESHQALSRSTAAVVAVVVAGVGAVGLLVLALAALVVVLRRGPVLALARARGGSVPQLLGLVVLGVGAAVVPATVVAVVAARTVVGSDVGGLDVLLAALVPLATLVACAGATWWRVHPPRRRRAVRPLVEAGLVGAAVVGVLAERERADQLAGGGTARGVDPLLAMVPVLVALAVAVVALRVLPPLVRRLGAARAGGPGLVSFLALTRASRRPAVAAAPLATVLVALGIAVLGTTAVRTVDDAQVSGTWRDVGADYRLEATYFPPESLAAVEALDGVDVVAAAHVRSDAAIVADPEPEQPAVALAVDAPAYADLLARAPDSDGSTGGVDGPAALRDLASDVDPEQPLPVLVTGDAGLLLGARAAGEREVDLGGGLGVAEVATSTVTERFPLDEGRALVVADLAAVQARESAPVRPNTLLVSGTAGLGDELADAVSGTGQDTLVLDRRAALERVQSSPFAGSTRDLVALGVLAAAAFAALALALGLVLEGPERRRDLAVLRRLGATRREEVRLAVTEQAPLVLGMLLGGVVAGLLLVLLTLDALGLAPLTGATGPPDPSPAVVATAVLVAGLLGLSVLATAATALAERRRPLSTATDGRTP